MNIHGHSRRNQWLWATVALIALVVGGCDKASAAPEQASQNSNVPDAQTAINNLKDAEQQKRATALVGQLDIGYSLSNEPDAEVRQVGILLLGQQGTDQAKSSLGYYQAHDPDPGVRQAATDMLRRWESLHLQADRNKNQPGVIGSHWAASVLVFIVLGVVVAGSVISAAPTQRIYQRDMQSGRAITYIDIPTGELPAASSMSEEGIKHWLVGGAFVGLVLWLILFLAGC